MVVMDHCTRRVIGFGVQAGVLKPSPSWPEESG
jgi:hypothetical protein